MPNPLILNAFCEPVTAMLAFRGLNVISFLVRILVY